MRIEQWAIVSRYGGPREFLSLPEDNRLYVNGIVYGHPTFADGKSITTSAIVKFEQKLSAKQSVLTESGSIYDLGEPSPAYTEWLNGRKKK